MAMHGVDPVKSDAAHAIWKDFQHMGSKAATLFNEVYAGDWENARTKLEDLKRALDQELGSHIQRLSDLLSETRAN